MRISIVTPTLNRARFLPGALASVREQAYPDVEHIVVDGLSTDGTAELLADEQVRVIRERDTGLYDALNKGIHAATGEVIGHLNSDDTYAPATFAAVAEAFENPEVQVVSGGAEILEAGGSVRHRFVGELETALTFQNATVGPAIPNARFFRRSFYEKVGAYDPRYRVAADREFLMRAALARPETRTISQIFYRYLWHSDSLTYADNPGREARWRDEYLAVAEGFLAHPALPAEARKYLRRWHRRESAQAATRNFRHGELVTAGRYARRGLRVDFGWPLAFFHHLGGALLGR